MKNKFVKCLLAIIMLLPCMLLFTACGEIKKLNGSTLVYSKVEVTGTLVKADYESEYKSISFVFDESTVTYKDGTEEATYDYKLEKGKLYLKDEGEEYSDTAYAEISGKFMIVSESYDGGTVKVYFKVK